MEWSDMQPISARIIIPEVSPPPPPPIIPENPPSLYDLMVRSLRRTRPDKAPPDPVQLEKAPALCTMQVAIAIAMPSPTRSMMASSSNFDCPGMEIEYSIGLKEMPWMFDLDE